MKKILVALFAVYSLNAVAALPPYYDRVKQMKTVLESQEVYALGAGLIEAVDMVAPYKFAVRFDQYSCTYLVDLEALIPGRDPETGAVIVGPTNYRVKAISQPTCERP